MAKKSFRKRSIYGKKNISKTNSYTSKIIYGKKKRKPFPKQTLPHSKIIYTTDDRPMKQIRHIFKQRTHIFVHR